MGNFSLLCSVIFIFFSVGVCSSEKHGRIIGGQPITNISSRPFHVEVEMIISTHRCSGAIISSRWVVTSGYCVALLLPFDIQVRVGTVNKEEGGTVYEASQVLVHPLFGQDWFTATVYDIGLIQTEMEISFNANVQPIALPSVGAELAQGTAVTVSGWGATSAGEGADLSPVLQLVALNILERSACNATVDFHGNITSFMICALGNIQDVCPGDNGGPLVANNILYGLVSWGIGCGQGSYVSVFTNTADLEIRSFINETTGL